MVGGGGRRMNYVPGVTPVGIAQADQAKATQPTVSVWVNASAGSGKTKVLTDRVLALLLAFCRRKSTIIPCDPVIYSAVFLS